MRILKIISVVLYLIAIIFVAISLFINSSYRIIGVIGYVALIGGGIISLIMLIKKR